MELKNCKLIGNRHTRKIYLVDFSGVKNGENIIELVKRCEGNFTLFGVDECNENLNVNEDVGPLYGKNLFERFSEYMEVTALINECYFNLIPSGLFLVNYGDERGLLRCIRNGVSDTVYSILPERGESIRHYLTFKIEDIFDLTFSYTGVLMGDNVEMDIVFRDGNGDTFLMRNSFFELLFFIFMGKSESYILYNPLFESTIMLEHMEDGA